ncbi:MAG: hypothetical protein ABS35_29235 [Kaistia sp. SCN 65-12]|nr:MAG: hypothetical protein ABS35_29235 [Kaistia sp. SCN 65-12]
MNLAIPVITPQAERYLQALAEELEIPPSRYEQAERSYLSFGEWLHREKSTVLRYDPQVYVQGSFRLGTAIKPLNDAEEYDVDSVCEFRLLQKTSLSQFGLKQLLGDEVKAYAREHGMTKPVQEGRRCWVLEYADGAQFHMDIVPAIPNATEQRVLLRRHGLDTTWASTAIAITDKGDSAYKIISEEWPRSNPKGYSEWFRSKVVDVERRRVSDGFRAQVESMPTYRIRTPLQSAIMILKRHRDHMFEHRYEERPISVILTTLATHAYQGDLTIGKALVSILSGMDSFIERVNGQDVIRNPTDPLENFADKWPKHPERRAAFYEWLGQARADFLQAALLAERQQISDTVARGIGRSLADKAAVRTLGLAAPAVLTAGLVRSEASARRSAVRLEGGGRNA